MSDYNKITDYAAKDVLLTGNPSKIVKGTEIGAEYDAISVAIATKANSASLSASGGSALVGFLQSGASAVATTAQEKLREFVSVFDFMTSAQIADAQANTFN